MLDSDSKLEMELVKPESEEEMPMPLNSLPAADPIDCAPLSKLRPFQRRGPKVEIQALAVQCSGCFKWRVVPSEDLYESIRESGKPWFCEDAGLWNPDASCSTPGDVELKQSCEDTIWALDKPFLPRTPHGWKRELVIRGQGSTKFGDIYYTSPCGKKLRSMVEISSFLEEHPEYAYDGVDRTQFCFSTPQPVDKSYVRKRNKGFTVNKRKALHGSSVKALRGPMHKSSVKALHGSSQPSRFPPVPEGWIRELEVRCSRSSKFCKVSYISPCGKRIRSLPEIDQFLLDNTHYSLSAEQFGFNAPTSDNDIVRVASEPGCKLRTAMTGSLPRLTDS